ncbi:Uncharacterised protein [Mycobacterium tuberculosis]|nr:Uncharacterised protein [Mycobacterium tuberculosis]
MERSGELLPGHSDSKICLRPGLLVNLTGVPLETLAPSSSCRSTRSYAPFRGSRVLYRAVAGHVPAEVAKARRQVNGRRLDRDRPAVAHFVPDVAIIDLG